ncbi:TetR/AcrR family transcriptional regulator [Rhabdothermincola salaria]|uniref:TetR/AcrR family transcriptional regulator n=1 Tax=Rhabdothermincola salaria TaxID=2903142 RepID=UPI001E5B6758|nr:TetR/AcrR family transcriptional regulator [Rhabdothermincola salaria]MCD9622726.1 TetR/AcrR family transcriptional regulator [Rhabdothermincola salaria]
MTRRGGASSGEPKTADVLLEVTIRLLGEHGEGGLRVEDVLSEAGASPSSLYHHYGNRDGLIEAARVIMFTRSVASDIEVLRTILDESETGSELLERILQVNRAVQDPNRAPRRRERLAILGSAADRPALWAALSEQQDNLTAVTAELIRDAQERGLMRSDLDARAVAYFIQAYTFGRVLSDVASEPVDPDEWMRVVDLVVSQWIVTDADTPTSPPRRRRRPAR